MRVGIADHFGWAIAVTVSPALEMVDRRRVELIEPGVCEAPIHYRSRHLDDAATAALVAAVRASIWRAADSAFQALSSELPAPIGAIALRAWPPDFPSDIATQRRAPYESRADAIMYRQVLAELARERGWQVHLYGAKDVEAQAEAMLGTRSSNVLKGNRERLGPPWTKDHQVALAAAIMAG